MRLLQCGLLAAALGVLAAADSKGAIIYSQPDVGYVGSTHLLTINDPDETMLNSLSDGTLTVSFWTPMRVGTVPGSWMTWGAPPDTESGTPRILASGFDSNFQPINSVLMMFSQPLSTFGLEVEPDDLGLYNVEVSYYSGMTLVYSTSREVEGNSGARLLAVTMDPGVTFDSVAVTSDGDWAVAQLRYGLAESAVPEPGTWALMAVGLGAVALRRRK